MRSIHFLAKNRIPQSTTYKELIELQVLKPTFRKLICCQCFFCDGDELQEKHLREVPYYSQCTSRFSARVLIEAIDIWIKKSICVVFKRVPNFPS